MRSSDFAVICPQVLTAYLTRVQFIIAPLVVSQIRIANNAVAELHRHYCLLQDHTQVCKPSMNGSCVHAIDISFDYAALHYQVNT